MCSERESRRELSERTPLRVEHAAAMADVTQVKNPMMAAEAAGDAIEDLADKLPGAAVAAAGKVGSIAVAGAGVASDIVAGAGDGLGENLAVAENVRQRLSLPPLSRLLLLL